ncbi:MAG: PRC-barrel domain-containing protein [Bacteroidota bacterium]
MQTLQTTPLLSTSSISDTTVVNPQGTSLGDIKDLMVDPQTGRVLYAVLDFGGFLGIGNKLFAVPLQAFDVDTDRERFVLNVTQERLENAPGFDQNDWPSSADTSFLDTVYNHYGVSRTTWERRREPALN